MRRNFIRHLHIPMIIPNFLIDSLSQLNYSTIHFVINTFSDFTFSYFSNLESAIQDSLPLYLYTSVHIISLIVPLVLVTVIIIPLCSLVDRALPLYTHLKANIRRPQ